ncbi:MAG TPA: PHP domain-containing protein [Xanthobacteraceae bacterium]|nr:PHP domain-containing protein [Xanthobacteraceae bacterium]
MAYLPESVPRYAELQVTSNFSFLRGGAHPDELVLTAAALGHQAIAITDRNSFAGIVRAHHAAKEIVRSRRKRLARTVHPHHRSGPAAANCASRARSRSRHRQARQIPPPDPR